MATIRKISDQPDYRQRAPAVDPKDRENQMIAMAIDIAEKKMRDGTAPAILITHYLKLATTREELEKEKLRKEIELLKAKTAAAESSVRLEELYANAISAMTSYGQSINHDEADYDQ